MSNNLNERNNSILLYCVHFYYRPFILVNSDETPSIKVCTVQQYTIIIKSYKINIKIYFQKISIVYDNFNIYKKQKITETDFNFIEICVRNQDNKNIELKDFWQISVYID